MENIHSCVINSFLSILDELYYLPLLTYTSLLLTNIISLFGPWKHYTFYARRFFHQEFTIDASF